MTQLVAALTASSREGRGATEELAKSLAQDRAAAAALQQQTVEALRNPRNDVKIFHGYDEEDYRAWMTAFTQVYPPSMPGRERLMGLWLKTGGTAKGLIEHLQTSDENYLIAVDRLEEKYGRADQVIARINRNFKAEKPVNSTEQSKDFRNIFNKIRSMVESYRQLNEPMSGSFMIEAWLEKLPRQVARKWAKATLNDHKVVEEVLDEAGNVVVAGNGLIRKGGNVEAFLEVVDEEVRTAEKLAALVKPRDDAKAANKQQQQDGKGNKAAKKPDGNSASLLAGQAGAGKPAAPAAPPAAPAQDGTGAAAAAKKKKNKKKKVNVTCQGCLNDQAGHDMAKCPVFLKLKPKERRDWAWELWRCKLCLEKSHKTNDCKSGARCNAAGCQYADRHCGLIHTP